MERKDNVPLDAGSAIEYIREHIRGINKKDYLTGEFAFNIVHAKMSVFDHFGVLSGEELNMLWYELKVKCEEVYGL